MYSATVMGPRNAMRSCKWSSNEFAFESSVGSVGSVGRLDEGFVVAAVVVFVFFVLLVLPVVLLVGVVDKARSR